ncbi:glycoside hydrolase family 88 protein [uncultured Sunxiuqinia sp.]|uniref:glycoside hydrolase family 88 protein n=1 Tax=uncultured Sunxiuqinia sp. TaxID=1573825 RepID=UPI002AA879EF|nr:glycoside hydrolase family 88 protein [uncultured Sunxiuqinia sp.]
MRYTIDKLLVLLLIPAFFISCSTEEQQPNLNKLVHSNLEFAEKQLATILDTISSSKLNPRSLDNGHLRLVKPSDWTSGFFPGNLWYMYEYSRDNKWKVAANHFSLNIEKEKYNATTHDMGFKLYCSFGNGFRLTNSKRYRDILLDGAKTLSKRFNPKVGCIRSWDHHADRWDYPVIIDNMINLELLFWATRETRDSSYYKIAVSHANKTLQNHFRMDYSSYHVVSYDTITGQPIKKNTHQGYSDDSAWARGQAWGLYGFTMVYRETGQRKFLTQAKHIAEFILNHPRYPSDGVPYWDFDDPNIPNALRDASAATVMCSALYELSMYCKGEEKAKYFNAADKILGSLSSEKYRTKLGSNKGFLLEHSVGNMPAHSEIDEPIIYADYYFLEGNLRRLKITGDWEGGKAPVVIKADDLRFMGENIVTKQWQEFADFAVEKNVHVTAGIVGSSLEEGTSAFFDWIKKYNEMGLFEFWNHGQLHKRWLVDGENTSEFFNQPVLQQAAYLRQTQDLAVEKLGFQFRTFGTPYNWCDENTTKALAKFPEIKVWLYAPQGIRTDKLTIERIPMLNIEYPVHHAKFYPFFNNYFFYSNDDAIAIQGHPSSWDEHGMDQYKMIVEYLMRIGAPIVKPIELLE